jgi:hypothetical protein
VAQDVGVAGTGLDAQAEQVGQATDVAAGGMGLVEDPVPALEQSADELEALPGRWLRIADNHLQYRRPGNSGIVKSDARRNEGG